MRPKAQCVTDLWLIFCGSVKDASTWVLGNRMSMDKFFTRLTYLSAVIFISLSSCKKEEKVEIPEDFPVLLEAERWELRAETRLFSNNSEIKDPSLIQDFEDREGLKNLFETPFDQSNEDLGLRFESEKVARFFHGPEQGELVDINRKGTRFIFQSRNTYWISPLAAPSANSLGYFQAMMKFKEPIRSSNSSGDRAAHQVWVAHGNFKVLKLSAFAYVLHTLADHQDHVITIRNSGVIFNEFDPVAMKYLKSTDTLAVKEYAVIYTLAN